jgi:prepilin-type N-terminal cleavage/methylation domain-containing protein
MSKQMSRIRKTRSGEGFSLVEMIIAMAVVGIAMIGGLAMIAVGIGRNGTMRMDTTSANIAQTFLEEIASVPPKNGAPLNITDCTGLNKVINTVGPGAPVWGAAPTLPGIYPGDIDFTQAVVPGYQADYVVCAPGGLQITYDVRWNIQTAGFVDAKGNTWGKLVTVAALQRATISNGALVYSPPVTLRTVVGM